MTAATGLNGDITLTSESDGRIPVLHCTSNVGVPERAARAGAAAAGLLDNNGVVVFRGFGLHGVAEFEQFARAVVPGEGVAVPYREPATPRHHVGGDVYSATDLDRRLEIFFHGENAHVLHFPRVLVFWCRRPADSGGATMLSDCAEVLARMRPELKQRWREVGVQYERRFGFGLGLSWAKAFGSSERADAEAYFQANHMSWEWEGEALRVRYNRWAVAPHPVSGQEVWFNNFAFYHPVTLQAGMRKMAQRMGYDRMPYAARWGDGTEVSPDDAEEVVTLYRQCALRTQWRQGDVMVIDNLRMAHGRESFEGERDVTVMMLDELSAERLGVRADLWRSPDRPG